jgi:hypothetical protein
MYRAARAVACFLLLAGFLVGCSRGPVEGPLGKRAIVKGKLTMGGRGVSKGIIVYTPLDPAKGDEQIGPINASGEYITSVFPGKYKVSVSDNTSVPSKYRSAKSTDLEVDINSSGKEDANFDLK